MRTHQGLSSYTLTWVLSSKPLGKKSVFFLTSCSLFLFYFCRCITTKTFTTCRNGSDTRGYFVWSFMDLYELLSGYEYSFGLYFVNFSDPHRKRTPKLSAHWYSAFLKDNTTFLGSQGIAQLQSNFSSPY